MIKSEQHITEKELSLGADTWKKMNQNSGKEDLEMLVCMVLDLVNNPKVKNGRIVRTLMYCICIIAIQNDVDSKIVVKNLLEVYGKLSVALGTETWFPPAES